MYRKEEWYYVIRFVYVLHSLGNCGNEYAFLFTLSRLWRVKDTQVYVKRACVMRSSTYAGIGRSSVVKESVARLSVQLLQSAVIASNFCILLSVIENM